MIELIKEKFFDSPISDRKSDSSSDFHGKSDMEIWDEFKSGSEIAFIFIYNQYFQTLYRFGSQFCLDRDLIKDAIQDLFIELLKKRQKLSNTTSIKYYLFKSLKINIISKLKKRKIDYRGELDGCDFGLSLSIEDKIVNSQLDEEKKQRIRQAIEKLKKSQREIIYYYYFEDLDLAHIASLMHFSNPKSAQNLLYRSLGLLKKSLQVCWCLALVHFILLFN